MTLGPIEVVVLAFPGSRFNGEILPELQRLVDENIITVVDGLLATKDAEGRIVMSELSELGADDDATALAGLLDQVESLISDEDVEELLAGLEPGSAAAVLVFEHTWSKGLREAIVGSGGLMTANFRVPGLVVQELLDELAAID
jgi:uncharacterized membrane protein